MAVGISATALVFGCVTVGPDYSPPDVSTPEQWNSDLGAGLRFELADPQKLASWWTTFDDPYLDILIKKAIAGNLDLMEARARVREARARRGIAQAERFPTLDRRFGYAH